MPCGGFSLIALRTVLSAARRSAGSAARYWATVVAVMLASTPTRYRELPILNIAFSFDTHPEFPINERWQNHLSSHFPFSCLAHCYWRILLAPTRCALHCIGAKGPADVPKIRQWYATSIGVATALVKFPKFNTEGFCTFKDDKQWIDNFVKEFP